MKNLARNAEQGVQHLLPARTHFAREGERETERDRDREESVCDHLAHFGDSFTDRADTSDTQVILSWGQGRNKRSQAEARPFRLPELGPTC